MPTQSPAVPAPYFQLTCSCRQELLEKVEQFRRDEGLSSRAKAIQALLERALALPAAKA